MRPGVGLDSVGSAGEYLANAPRHVRYVAELRRQVREVSAAVEASRRELLQRIEVMMDPKWRPPPEAPKAAPPGRPDSEAGDEVK